MYTPGMSDNSFFSGIAGAGEVNFNDESVVASLEDARLKASINQKRAELQRQASAPPFPMGEDILEDYRKRIQVLESVRTNVGDVTERLSALGESLKTIAEGRVPVSYEVSCGADARAPALLREAAKRATALVKELDAVDVPLRQMRVTNSSMHSKLLAALHPAN